LSSGLTHVPSAKQAKDTGDSQPEKKTRKKKDADAPKKPMGAFFWYQQARREAIKKEKPELGHKEVIKVSNQSLDLSSIYPTDVSGLPPKALPVSQQSISA
jgi:hypothetical protein